MIAGLSLRGMGETQLLNGFKNLLGAVMAGASIAALGVGGQVAQTAAELMMMGSPIGGLSGARIAQQIDAKLLRLLILAFSFLMALFLLQILAVTLLSTFNLKRTPHRSPLMKFIAVLTLLFAPCVAFAQTSPSTLARIAQSGVLRVCTPGDYKPFSFQRAPGEFEGLDVDMMGSLAATLNARPEFVKTTWANLLPDFVAGKCDIAAGGISVSLERQKQAYFSAPYMVNGKTPITRCEDIAKYQTIAAIDLPNVRVITNPGGSNERFARAKLSHAQLTIHSDNLTIFDELIKGKADVFVTEAAEAIVQSKAHPELCAVSPDKPLQYAEMGYLLPNGDDVFRNFVDQWLHLSKANGDYAQLSAKWLGK